VTLREDYEKTKSQSDWNLKWVKAFEPLEKIINEQWSPLIKIGLGCNHKVLDPQGDDEDLNKDL